MATLITLIFFALVGLGCWFIVRQIRKAFRLRNLQLKDAEERETERKNRRAA
jgi:flagellar biosynthesis/type III secretory pathway M-ring protein FliF/YscJ